MIRILCIEHNPDIACSWYRSKGVLPFLQKKFPNTYQIAYVDHPPLEWDYLNQFDIVMFNRPRATYDFDCLEVCKLMGIKIWVDNDDDILTINPDNPSVEFFTSEKTQNTVRTFLNEADLLTFSTKTLADSMGKYHKAGAQIRVIPNSWNDYRFPIIRTKASDSKSVIWRGGDSHRNDTLHNGEYIIDAAHNHPDWEFYFMGMNCWWIYEYIKDSKWSKGLPIMQYMYHMVHEEYGIAITPLMHNKFNYGKSNISWMEPTMSGAVGVIPDYYDCETGYKYAEGKFGEALERAFNSDRDAMWQLQMEEIKDKFLLSKNLDLHKEAIESIL